MVKGEELHVTSQAPQLTTVNILPYLQGLWATKPCIKIRGRNGSFLQQLVQNKCRIEPFLPAEGQKKKNHRSVKEFTEATCLITCFRSDF